MITIKTDLGYLAIMAGSNKKKASGMADTRLGAIEECWNNFVTNHLIIK